MRKVISVLLVLTLIVSAVGVSYAATPRYVSINNYSTGFSINEDGLATYKVNALPKGGTAMDRVTATIKILNASGTAVYNQTKTLTYSAVSGLFSDSGTHQLSSRGQYRLQVTFKCYDGTTLLETIPANVKTASW